MADDNDLNIGIGADASAVKPGTDAAKAGIKSVSAEAKQLEASFKRIKSAIDPTFAATQKYNRTLEDTAKLLKAERISQDEATAAKKAAKAALDAEISAIERATVAGKTAAEEKKRLALEERARIAQAQQDARNLAKEKAQASRDAAAAVEAAQRREANSIRLSAQAARQAAIEARRLAAQAAAPSTRGVGPGSVDSGGRSLKQLEYDSKRASDAAAAAAVRAMDAAARAAESTSARTARAAENAAQQARAAAESASARAITLARARASEEGRINVEAAMEAKAAREIEKQAIREAAQEASRSAKEKRAAERAVIQARKEAAEAARQLAIAERESSRAAAAMRSSIDPAFAAQERYNDTMRTATALLFDNKLKQGEWNAIQRQAKSQMDLNVRSLGRQNAMYVQLGYQAQDVTASLASGINPLVILAQQGGQTAAALSTMGGTIGKVAAFMAGPWGAAIIGFTLLIGYLTSATKEEEEAAKKAGKAELDLNDATKVRTASLKELSAAIEEFNKKQEKATQNSYEQAEADYTAAKNAYARAIAIREATKAYLADAIAQNADTSSRDPMTGDIQYGQERGAIRELTAELAAAEKEALKAREALDNVEILRSKQRAAVGSDERKAVVEKYEREEAAATALYRKSKKTKEDLARMDAELLRIAKAREAAEDAITKSNREQTKIKKERTGDPIGDIKRAADLARSRGLKVGTIGPNGVSTGPGHREGRAVDINYIGGENSKAAQTAMDKYALDLQKMGYTVLWNGKRYSAVNGITTIVKPKNAKGDWNHVNHLHAEAPAEGAFVRGSVDAAVDAERDMKKLREDALKSFAEDIDYKQELARDDFTEQLRLQDEKLAAFKDFYGEDSQEYIRAEREKARIQKQFADEKLAQARQDLQTQSQLAQDRETTSDTLGGTDRGQRSDNIDFNQRNGLISAREGLTQKLALLNEEFAAQVDHENRMYQLKVKALRDQLALENLPPAEKRRINSEIEMMEAAHQNSLLIMHRDYVRSVNLANQDMANLHAQKWKEISETVSQQLTQSFQGIWTGSQGAIGAIVQLADQLVFKLFDAGLKIVQNWATAQFMKKAITTTTEGSELATHTATEAAKTGITVGAVTARTTAETAGLTASTIAGAASRVSQVIGLSGVAGAAAFASTAAIPIIGPALAPGAMAAAIAAVMGMAPIASAAGGQERVPYDGQITELHKDEMVLPSRIANPLRDSLSGIGPQSRSGSLGNRAASVGSILRERSAASSGTSFGDINLSMPISAIDTQSGVDFIMKNRRMITKAVEDSVRKGARKKK